MPTPTVEIKAPEVITVKATTPPEPVAKADELTLPPKTTVEEDLVAHAQRRISFIWEATQAVVALMITAAVIYNSIRAIESQVLTNAFFLIVSMYFVRTNHNKVGASGDRGATES